MEVWLPARVDYKLLRLRRQGIKSGRVKRYCSGVLPNIGLLVGYIWIYLQLGVVVVDRSLRLVQFTFH